RGLRGSHRVRAGSLQGRRGRRRARARHRVAPLSEPRLRAARVDPRAAAPHRREEHLDRLPPERDGLRVRGHRDARMTRDAAAAMRRERDALFSLGRMLEAQGYAFVTPTPSTHARVVARKLVAEDLRDVFGWNLPFEPSLLPSRMRELLVEARACELDGSGRLRSTVRFSTL